MHRHYGSRIRILHWCSEQAMTGALADMELTSAQGHILGYIHRHPGAPCAKDIEEALHLSHPTVSGLLTRLEKKGFLEFREDPRDRRFKRIYILPKGEECNEQIHQIIQRNEENLVAGFTEEEKRQFMDYLGRAIVNMGGCPEKQRQNKEDT
ncbi:MAG: MarR family transcriptional regulator [Firmicutes bacterium]|nr:MarR family transcriptional regulator [Bacillota bacterium]